MLRELFCTVRSERSSLQSIEVELRCHDGKLFVAALMNTLFVSVDFGRRQTSFS
jgi:hypothetical protein